MVGIMVRCSYCGSDINIKNKRRLKYKNNFCNKKCESLFRNKRPNVRCHICGKPFAIKASRLVNDGVCCSTKCGNLYRSSFQCGQNNPNFKYKKDLSMFYNLTHDGAYILGLIYSDGSITDTVINIYQSKKYSYTLYQISKLIFGSEDNVRSINKNSCLVLEICDKNFVSYVLSLGGVKVGKKDSIVEIPNIPEDKKWSFICGYFDGDGGFKYNYRYPAIKITSNSSKMLKQIAKYWAVNYTNKKNIYACGYKALDICGKMYENVSLRHSKKYDYYVDILNWEPLTGGRWFKKEYFKYKKLDKNSLAPYKKRVTDSGYDVSAIELYKDDVSGMYIADTRLAVEPIPGYYFDLIGRSSLFAHGFQFSLGVGVIDRSYVGSLKMPLIRINDKLDLPKLPFRCGQLIPRKILHVDFIETQDLNASTRNDGGFGSTGI